MKIQDTYNKIKEYCDMITMHSDVSLEISSLDLIHTYTNTGYTFSIKMCKNSQKYHLWSYAIQDDMFRVNGIYRVSIENISSFKDFVNSLLPKSISDLIDVSKVERLSKINKVL